MSKKIVLKTENISKQYMLGQVGTGTISHDLNRMWARLRGKEDPYLLVGDANDRSMAGGSEYVWSLRDINFEVREGEVLGIIGKNGAGKSTLLKILSQVTSPTTGKIKIKGRIAALLEVGTGFHPDLSGRENVFLNGAILGMTKAEIKSKLDEIVEFSGVAKYLDTPVKRYSSGMMVRLGFAVAAHLEPEILIVDEVLAVGDAEFQKKCLGKMKDVSGQGRTVLFVSHNMDAIANLTSRCLLLEKGRVIKDADTPTVVSEYYKTAKLDTALHFGDINTGLGNENIRIKSIQLLFEGSDMVRVDRELKIQVEFWNLSPFEELVIGMDLFHISGVDVMSTGEQFTAKKGALSTVTCTVYANLLNDDIYSVFLMFFNKSLLPLYSKADVITFEVKDTVRDSNYTGKINGLVRPKLNWSIR
jgi:lipopolysaccharide transport system ATP-binding protein